MRENNFSLFVSKLSQTIQNRNDLTNLLNRFLIEYGLKVVVGFELEFYLSDNIDVKKLEKLIDRTIKAEKGKNQYEIDLEPSSDILEAIKIFYHYKQLIIDSASKLGGEGIFDAKPFETDYGNSVHIHVNFINKKGENFFEVEENILHASRSICHFMLETFLIFAYKPDHYLRLKSYHMNPVNVSMGKNNRTTSIRIPYSLPKRIEHRLSAPDIDLYLAVYVILKSIYNGITNPNLIDNYEIIHGNAFDKQYVCKIFPNQPIDARKLFNKNFLLTY